MVVSCSGFFSYIPPYSSMLYWISHPVRAPITSKCAMNEMFTPHYVGQCEWIRAYLLCPAVPRTLIPSRTQQKMTLYWPTRGVWPHYSRTVVNNLLLRCELWLDYGLSCSTRSYIFLSMFENWDDVKTTRFHEWVALVGSGMCMCAGVRSGCENRCELVQVTLSEPKYVSYLMNNVSWVHQMSVVGFAEHAVTARVHLRWLPV